MFNGQSDHLFLTDVGSTTTKGLLLARRSGGYQILGAANVPTTVEKPLEDVCLGIRAAAEAVARQAGVQLLDPHGALAVPYLTTSSAGGGLQMLVIGLTSTDTGRIAQLTAQGAGGVILRCFTVDDRTPTVHKMRLIRELHPDLILMAGGVDGGDIANVVRLAEILALAHPTPKFDPAGRIPLVFCGNVEARDYVTQVLTSAFDLHVVDNIRPNLTETNPTPAKEAILRLFMDTVMERAPGYATLKGWVFGDIIPTPTGVERILELYARAHERNVVMVDMGGATTDVFSNIYGDYRRTVAANIGVSYSICNVIGSAGIEHIMRHIPPGITADDVRDYCGNKMLNPTYLPTEESELIVERALAIAGIGLAWQQHQDMNFTVAKVGLLDRLRGRQDFDPFQDTFLGIDPSTFFHVSDIDVIIGAGGVLSHAPAHEATRILVDAFLPTGITKLAVDASFRSPHLGVLSTVDAPAALDLFQREVLKEIAYVVAPTCEGARGDVILSIRDSRGGIDRELQYGDVFYAPTGGEWQITPAPGTRLYQGTDEVTISTSLPVLFDCRGRGKTFSGSPLISYGALGPGVRPTTLQTQVHRAAPHVERGSFELTRELPYEGTLFVGVGDRVMPDTPIGENVFTPPRIYIVDIQRLVGYQRRLTAQDLHEGILVAEGDQVSMGQRIFRGRESFLGMEYYCNSPVRGTVAKIEAGGLIVFREIQDYSRKPVRVEVARFLGIPPKSIKSRVEFEVGDFVQKGQDLVRGAGMVLPIKAPSSGTVKEIDTDNGTVLLQYDVQPVITTALIRGTVVRIEAGHAATVTGEGVLIWGAIGFGGEGFGPLRIVEGFLDPQDAYRDCIVASLRPVDEAFLERCRVAGVSGLVAPSVKLGDWVRFAREEIVTGVTGDEDVPYPVLLTEGFGGVAMSPSCTDVLRQSEGRVVSLCTRTQIRAGVIRPMLAVNDEGV